MVYQIDNIIADVRTAMDMNPQDEGLISENDTDTLSLNYLISSKIEDAAYAIELVAPLDCIDSGNNLSVSVFWDERKDHEGTGWMILPTDFMRLVVFRMSDWERPVYNVIDETSPLYGRQSSKFAGVRGNVANPVVAVVKRSTARVLEFYSCNDSTAEVDQAVYLARPKKDEHGGIELCERCYRAIVYYTAGLAQSALGNNDQAGVMYEMAKQMIGLANGDNNS